MWMSSDLTLLKRNRASPEPTGARETSFYPDDLLPALQGTLASLADLEVRYEIERDYLEDWPGPDEAKRLLLAALDVCRQRDRESIVARLSR
jgi:hypothetical protein